MELETKQLSDDALVARFRRGDADAFAELYQRHRHGLYGYALSLTRDEARAADVAQELWLGFLESVERLASVVNIQGYLYRSLRNRVMDDFRRKKREQKALAEGSQPLNLVRPRDTVVSREEAESLNKALARLPQEQQEVVLLRIYGEMKFADIADVLQTNTKTVESRHRLALEKLREWLQTTEE
ncbi:MAG: sigma-70 family RNA polymerase sigma factor [Planctomycetes bacterium]|nr:sigma-70 family RNA polymerase sigma factor [Planctomycetota bacterium]MCA8945849.1 sigma-70 family RNA polymerase sigma factor [Planctomycetota bacterium]